jgi:DNA-binding NarL/FixJ family response regulator
MPESRIRIAVLDPLIASQLRTQSAASEIELVWAGDELSDLVQSAPEARPTVIVADFDRLGADPAATAKNLLSSSGAELVVIAYTFARREELRRLEAERVRIVRAPISVDALKLSMMSVLVRGILRRPVEASPASVTANTKATNDPARTSAPSRQGRGEIAVTPPRFDPSQLGKLQEISSSIQCECPNHVAATLVSLRAFEDYSLTCIDRDAKDAAIHRMLYQRTAEARRIMEEALVDLLKHEAIVL